jgi:hypothetical protein
MSNARMGNDSVPKVRKPLDGQPAFDPFKAKAARGRLSDALERT